VTDPLVTIVAFVIVLGTLIMVHELGHFTMAKFFKVKVFEFGMGFPPRIASIKHNDTLYSLNALPLGGFVKMMGENGDDAGNPASFGAKPWWQRAIILVAGPAMNLALALFLFFITAAWLGTPVATNVIATTEKGSPAQAAGLVPGDRIVAINGHSTAQLQTIHNITQNVTTHHPGQRVSLTVVRAGKTRIIFLVPRVHPAVGQGAIGIGMTSYTQRYPVGVAARKSFEAVGSMIMAVPNIIGSIGAHGTSNVSGPIGIARVTGESANAIPQFGIGQFLAFVALLSANLGVLNLLPIPALDGGRLVLVVVSGIRRKNLNPEVEGLIHLAGMAVLLTLIVLVSYQDILHWATGS
jgi:regulator of sigma E protease